MSAWKLTIRHGSDVKRERFDDLDAALAALRRSADGLRREGRLGEVEMLRRFEPADQVHARLEIAGQGLLRPPTVGIDLRGDGSMVAFTGSVRRREIEPADGQTVFDALRGALDERER